MAADDVPPTNEPPPWLRVVRDPPPEKESHPNQYAKTSATQRKLAKRQTALRPHMQQRRDRYIAALLQGATRTEAALAAGVPKRSAARQGCELWWEPYVQEKFRELREALSDEQLLTRAELVLNVKGIAFDPKNRALARVAASNLLAEIMDFKSPVKVDQRFLGGVMVVHSTGSMDDWEKAAREAQKQLRADVAK